jgi:hypothetical protein
MATFPTLRTGAVAQYPLTRSLSFTTQSVRFLDGSQQDYRMNAGGLRRWRLSLDQLDETELAAIIAFADEVGTGMFAFTDPVTGDTVPKCVISDAQIQTALIDELNGQTSLEIEEVK